MLLTYSCNTWYLLRILYIFLLWDITLQHHERFVYILVAIIVAGNISSYILRLVCHFSVIFFMVPERMRSNLVFTEVVHEYDNQLCNASPILKEIVGLSGKADAIVLL